MTVYKGGVLTDSGCGIAPQELNETYEDVWQFKILNLKLE
jgi:hypothetical protein